MRLLNEAIASKNFEAFSSFANVIQANSLNELAYSAAVESHHPQYACIFKDSRLDVNWHNPEDHNYTFLIRAVMNGNEPAVDALLSRADTDINVESEPGSHFTAATAAAEFKDTPGRRANIARKIFSDPRFDAVGHKRHLAAQSIKNWDQTAMRIREALGLPTLAAG